VKQVQRFSDEYLRETRKIPPLEILQFLEDFRLLHGTRAKSRLISLKVPEPLLRAFRLKCEAQGTRYQTRIKELMAGWLEDHGG